jgi:hypothetical protein
MSISDTLSEAKNQILEYVEDGVYGEGEALRPIAVCVLAMDRLRRAPGFDTPPGHPAPVLPSDADALAYLEQERERWRNPPGVDVPEQPKGLPSADRYCGR